MRHVVPGGDLHSKSGQGLQELSFTKRRRVNHRLCAGLHRSELRNRDHVWPGRRRAAHRGYAPPAVRVPVIAVSYSRRLRQRICQRPATGRWC